METNSVSEGPTHHSGRQFGRTARRKARNKALDLLFEADLRGSDLTNLDEVIARREQLDDDYTSLPEYTRELLAGVEKHATRIDELIRTYSEGWELSRMPAVDRNILRIGIYELMYGDDIPDIVAIDEAVALSKELSTDDSPRFINGVLGRIQLLKDV